MIPPPSDAMVLRMELIELKTRDNNPVNDPNIDPTESICGAECMVNILPIQNSKFLAVFSPKNPANGIINGLQR